MRYDKRLNVPSSSHETEHHIRSELCIEFELYIRPNLVLYYDVVRFNLTALSSNDLMKLCRRVVVQSRKNNEIVVVLVGS